MLLKNRSWTKVQNYDIIGNRRLQAAEEVTCRCSSVVTFNGANLAEHGSLMENIFF